MHGTLRDKKKQCISSRRRRNLVHDAYFSTKCLWKEGHFTNIPEI